MLENTPWRSRRVDLPLRVRQPDEPRGSGAPLDGLSAAASSSSPGAATVPVELRWGTPVRDLRAVWHLHELCFPMTYLVAYYRWLTEPSCLCLLAYTTPKALRELELRRKELGAGNAADGVAPSTTAGKRTPVGEAEVHATTGVGDESARREVSATIAAAESRARGDYLLMDCAMAQQESRTMGEIDAFVTELEYISEKEEEAARRKVDGQGAGSADEAGEKNAPEGHTADDASSLCTEVVGFVCAQLAFAQDRLSHFFPNPTGYIGSVAVLPAARCLGVGKELVDEILLYLTTRLPLRASLYLHYDAAQMRSTAWAVYRNARDPTSQAETGRACEGGGRRATERPAARATSLLRQLTEYCFPECHQWLEHRQRRKELLASGLTAEQADERLAALEEARTQEEREQEAFFAALSPERQQELLDPVVQTGVREVWLHCLAADAPLQRFYFRRGFVQALPVIGDYYQFGGGSHDATLLLYAPADGVSSAAPASAAAADGAPPPLPTDDLASVAERRHAPAPRPAAAPVAAAEPTTMRRRDTTGAKASSDDGEDGAARADAAATSATAGLAPADNLAITHWLTRSTYSDVECVDPSRTLADSRAAWQETRDRYRHLFAMRRRRLQREQEPTALLSDSVKEALFTLNAAVSLVAVLYFVYNYGVQ